MEESKLEETKDPVEVLKKAIVYTNTNDKYSSGFRNGLRYAIAILTDTEPKFEDGAEELTRWRQIGTSDLYECVVCGQAVMTKDIDAYDYCHGCGRKVDWD